MRSVLLLQREELNMLNLTAHVWGHDAPKEKPHGAQHTEGPENNSTAILPVTHNADKQFKTLQAQAALAGHRLQRHGNVFLISRWGHAKQLDSLDAVAAWIDRVGGVPA